jgi:hypothetical protein
VRGVPTLSRTVPSKFFEYAHLAVPDRGCPDCPDLIEVAPYIGKFQVSKFKYMYCFTRGELFRKVGTVGTVGTTA